MTKDTRQCLSHPNYIAAKERSIETSKEKARQRESAYLESPNVCTFCNIALSYTDKHKKFCNPSCAAKYNNTRRSPETRIKQRQKLLETLADNTADNPVQIRNIKNQRFDDIIKAGKVPYTRVYLNTCIVCSDTFYRNLKVKTCSKECASKRLSSVAKNNKALGGNKNNKAHGYYTSPTAGTVWLESSYELKVAQELDNHNIAWSRPSYFNYTLNEQTKKYYPDFHLTDLNIYLDPKNDFLIIQDADKIKAVSEQNNIIVIILTKHQLSWEKIKFLIP